MNLCIATSISIVHTKEIIIDIPIPLTLSIVVRCLSDFGDFKQSNFQNRFCYFKIELQGGFTSLQAALCHLVASETELVSASPQTKVPLPAISVLLEAVTPSSFTH